MNRQFSGPNCRQRRRGVVAVQVAILLVVLIGFAALTVDVGAMYNSKADLQRTADAAALAAAAMLAKPEAQNPLQSAVSAAVEYTQKNHVFGRELTLGANDVVFGRASFDAGTGSYDFSPTPYLPNAVQVSVRQTAGSSNGALPLYFARIFGFSETNIAAKAVAIMIPRDIAIVADLSASHNDDSELASLGQADINLLDVWSGVPVQRGVNGVGDGVTPPPPGDPANPAQPPTFGPGHPGDGGNDPGTAPQGGQTGPTFGHMYYWGDSLDNNYVIQDDPGLTHLPRYQDWTNADLVQMYETIGYSNAEIDGLLSHHGDGHGGSSGHWANRVAVALGLARWDSGIPGGLWESLPAGQAVPGNGNGKLGAGEMVTLVDYPYPSSTWNDYIYNYVRSSNTKMAWMQPDFRYRFGLKTFVNYLMERRFSNDQTPDLAGTPHQPMKAVQDAVVFLTDHVTQLDTDDLVSLEIYGTDGRHEVDLTQTYSLVSDRLSNMQAGHYNGWTNMGGGLQRAIEELTGTRARDSSVKMIILLTDGNANVSESGQPGNTAAGAAWALDRANAAAALGIRIFAVSVGSGSNQSLMAQIADIGQGEHFHAEGSVQEYSAQLADIFWRLGGTRPVQLVQ